MMLPQSNVQELDPNIVTRAMEEVGGACPEPSRTALSHIACAYERLWSENKRLQIEPHSPRKKQRSISSSPGPAVAIHVFAGGASYSKPVDWQHVLESRQEKESGGVPGTQWPQLFCPADRALVTKRPGFRERKGDVSASRSWRRSEDISATP